MAVDPNVLKGLSFNPIYNQPSNPNAIYNAGIPAISIPRSAVPNATVNNQGNFVVSNPAPQPQQQQSQQPAGYHGNGSFGDPAHPDLSNPSKQSDYNNYLNSQKQNDLQSQLNAQIDALANQANQIWDQQENTLRNTDYPLVLSQINQNYDEATGQVKTQTQNQLGTLDQQQNVLNQNSRSAYDQAVSAFNALQQQGQSRFGQGSSTGGAIGELAQREFFKAQGSNENSRTNAQSTLDTNRNTALDWQKNQLDTYQKNKDLSIQQANADFQHNLQAINQNRALTESQKTQQKIASLQGMIDFAKQQDLMDEQFSYNMKLVQSQNADLFKQNADAFNQTTSAFNTNPFTASNTKVPLQQSQQQTPYAYNYVPLDQQQKEMQQLQNPFA